MTASSSGVPVQDTTGTENAAGEKRTRFVLDKDGDPWSPSGGAWRTELVPASPAPLSGVSADSEKAEGTRLNDAKVGDHVEAVLHGTLVDYNDELGIWTLQTDGRDHIPWRFDLHWSQPFKVIADEAAGRDVKDRQREDGLPAEIVDVGERALNALWMSRESGDEPTPTEEARTVLEAAVAAGLLKHLLETSGYTKLSEGRSTYKGKTALPFTAEQSVYETVARQMPGITFEQRDVWSSPWTPLASSPAVSL